MVLGLDRDLSCAVCRALVDEVEFEIRKIDPKKTIQVGSFRVDSKGNQGTYEKPYARSEVHLLELFEHVCEKFKDYAESTNSAGQRSVARTAAREGGTLSLSNIKISGDTQKVIKFHCEHLVEEFEEEMISLFRRNTQDIEKHICCDITRQCSAEDLLIPMPSTENVGGFEELKPADEEKDDSSATDQPTPLEDAEETTDDTKPEETAEQSDDTVKQEL